MPPGGDDPKPLGATAATNPLEAFLAIGTSAEDACHAVLEVLGEGLVITDPGGVIRHATARFAAFVGATPDALGGRLLLDLLDESFGRDVTEALGHRTGSVLNLDRVRFLRDDGEGRVADVTLTAFRGANKAFAGWLVLVRDRTDEVKREEAQRRQDELIAIIADGVPAAIAYVDRDLRYVYANRAFVDWGYGSGVVVGATVREVVGEAVYAEIAPTLTTVLAGRTVSYEAHRSYPDGRPRFVQVTHRPHRDARGQVVGFFALLNDVTELKLAEQAALKNEQRLRLIADNLPLLIAYVDRDEVYRFANQHYRTLGFPVDAMVGKRVHEVLAPEHYAKAAPLIKEALAGTPQNYQMTWPYYGRERHVDITYVPHRDDGGEVVGCFVMALDVTERKNAEDALVDSERRFRSLFEAAPFGIAFVDNTTHRVERVNAAFASMLGYEPDELVGLALSELVHPDDVDDQRQALEGLCSNRFDQVATERRYVCRDGSTVWARLKSFLLKDENGRVLHAVGMTEDITEQVRLVAELRQAKDRFEKLVATLPVGVGIVRDRKAVFVNPAMCRIMGYGHDELVGRSLDGLIEPIGDSAFAPLYEQFGQGKLDVLTGVVKARRGDGSVIDLEIVASAFEQPEGPSVIYLCTDVTRAQELEHQLIRAQKMQAIGTLAGGIAHDFNNLLTGIGGHAGFLRGLLEQNALPTEDADGILRLQRRGASLTEKLLALGRRRMIRMVPVDVNRLIRDFAGLARRIIGERIELVTELADDMPSILADPLQFEQVLLNLVVNARDAMAQGGTLTLSTRREEKADGSVPTAVLSVVDTGHGIDPSIVDRIFEPFFTTKEFGKGTGLGLAVAYGIVEQHRGTIRALPRDGGGTEFRIELPSTVAVPALTPPNLVPALHDTGGTETILVAEDDENLRDLARRVLERKGYRVLLAADGDEAVKLFDREHGRISLLLFDVAMPRKGGLDALAEIRAVSSDLPAILVSGYSDRLTEQTSRELGSPAFLRKPFSNEQLLHEVRTALDHGSSNDTSKPR